MKRMWIIGLLATALSAAGCAEKKDCDCCGEKEKEAPKKSTATRSETKYADFGEKMTLAEKDTVALDRVLANPDQYKDKLIRVSATVKDVCQHKGCWINMTDKSGKDVYVKFSCPISGRLIPVDAKGKSCIVEGKLIVEEVSEDEARHVAEEAGKSDAEIRKIVGPQKRIRMSAPAAKIADVEAGKAVY